MPEYPIVEGNRETTHKGVYTYEFFHIYKLRDWLVYSAVDIDTVDRKHLDEPIL